jgi:hypothetical protein
MITSEIGGKPKIKQIRKRTRMRHYYYDAKFKKGVFLRENYFKRVFTKKMNWKLIQKRN